MNWEEFCENLLFAATQVAAPQSSPDMMEVNKLESWARFRLVRRYGEAKLAQLIKAAMIQRFGRNLRDERERRMWETLTTPGRWVVYRHDRHGERTWVSSFWRSLLFRNVLGGGAP